MTAPVYVYYELQNFYQNHRRYVKSRNDKQLAGTMYTDPAQLSDCDPLRTVNGKVLDPCGLIANSYFNGMLFALLSLLVVRHCAQCRTLLVTVSLIVWARVSFPQYCIFTRSRLCADTIALTAPGITMLENDISWASDRNKKFKAPSAADQQVGGDSM